MKHALCIGINNYPGTGSDLAGCVNDANDWAEALSERGFLIETLLDEQATLQNMQYRIKTTIEKAEYGDTVVITFSGHGTWLPDTNSDEPDGRDEALCPYDISENGGPLTDDDLFGIFSERERGVKVVLVSDSCHSGSVNRFADLGGETAGKVKFLPPETFLKGKKLQLARSIPSQPLRTLPKRSTALLLAGCKDYEYSYDAYFDGRSNGAFTYVALQVLSALPVKATYRDWMKAMRAMLPSQRYPQTPIIAGTSTQRTWGVLA